jgi:DNA-binding NtrC family response regulator
MSESDLPPGATPISLDERLLALQASLIAWALQVTHGNQSKAAALLKIKRSTLGDLINRCGLGRSGMEAAGTTSQAA